MHKAEQHKQRGQGGYEHWPDASVANIEFHQIKMAARPIPLKVYTMEIKKWHTNSFVCGVQQKSSTSIRYPWCRTTSGNLLVVEPRRFLVVGKLKENTEDSDFELALRLQREEEELVQRERGGIYSPNHEGEDDPDTRMANESRQVLISSSRQRQSLPKHLQHPLPSPFTFSLNAVAINERYNRYALALSDFLEPEGLVSAVLTTYNFDLEWIFATCPFLARIPFTLVHGDKGSLWGRACRMHRRQNAA